VTDAERQGVSRIEQLCTEKGLRMTDQRRVIARVLSDAIDHPDAEELHGSSRMRAFWNGMIFGTVGHVTRKCPERTTII
jgi:hypothetical protein